MELRQIEYFVAVAEQLHFGRAAEALSIGQPAVSQQVARLERELGVHLFDRSARTVRLTDAGGRFLPEARAVIAAVARARAVAADSAAGAPVHVLRIGSSAGLGDRLGRVLSGLDELVPGTVTELTSAPTQVRLDRVAGGQLDAAFVRGVSSARGVELIEVWRDRLLVVLPAGHELARREDIEFAALASLPLRIVPRRMNPPLVDLVVSACTDAGFTPALGGYPGNLENLIAAVAAGAPSWTVIFEAQARTLHRPQIAILASRPCLDLPTLLAVRKDATSREVAPLLRACALAGSVRA